jgi:hypothetical protein
MEKPKSDNNIKSHHYQMDTAADALCYHLCQKDINHKNDNFHLAKFDNSSLPDIETSKNNLAIMFKELNDHSTTLKGSQYSAIYAQLAEAQRTLRNAGTTYLERRAKLGL